ncbi:DNA-processing protein DprA [Nonomuraea sp. NPDC049158]|uniref:DNA-processing protein DprA n=1 Tax=Nonomuraea sp. NPDC049158 TaxID=3155649 RepID=UPI0033E9F2D6
MGRLVACCGAEAAIDAVRTETLPPDFIAQETQDHHIPDPTQLQLAAPTRQHIPDAHYHQSADLARQRIPAPTQHQFADPARQHIADPTWQHTAADLTQHQLNDPGQQQRQLNDPSRQQRQLNDPSWQHGANPAHRQTTNPRERCETTLTQEQITDSTEQHVTAPGQQFGTALTERRTAELTQRLRAWRARLESADPAADLANGERSGARFIIPGSPEWPTQLDQLGPRRPLGLWLHGSADLRFSCLRSIAVVGARAATAYGVHVAAQFAVGFSDSGWTVVSGGAFGIDGAAHRGSLAADSPTVVVLACGVDVSYPTGHHELFAAARDQGVVVSECPPGVHPTRARFLIRNRLIAALSRGTVVVEAALRSGALNTAGHALSLQRHLAAVPGPITSTMSAGCHRLLRERKAVCVTSPEEVIELVGAIGDDLAPQPRGPVVPRDTLSETTSRVLDAIPTRGAAGPASIAVAAGVSLDAALSALGGLAAAGYIERVAKGWRTRKTPSRTYVKADETAPPRQYPSDLTDDDDLPPSPDDP